MGNGLPHRLRWPARLASAVEHPGEWQHLTSEDTGLAESSLRANVTHLTRMAAGIATDQHPISPELAELFGSGRWEFQYRQPYLCVRYTPAQEEAR